MNRIERIAAILIRLQSRTVITAQELADAFDISIRTVYRDIRALEASGVPIAAEAGTGYSLAEGYKLPPVHFTTEEVVAFLTAEKLVAKLTDAGINDHFQSGITKIKAVLRYSDKDYLETIEENIIVIGDRYVPQAFREQRNLPELIRSISDKRTLRISYRSGGQQPAEERTIEPVGIFFLPPHWHVMAYCQLRSDYRQFRLDRIVTLLATDKKSVRKHPSLDTFIEKYFLANQRNLVKIEFKNEVLRHLGDQVYYHGLINTQHGETHTVMTFQTRSIEGMARWYMMVSDYARIISPPELAVRVKEIFEAAKKSFNY